MQNQSKDLPLPGSKDEDGRERRHTGGAGGGATGQAGAGTGGVAASPAKPNPPSGDNKPKLARQNSQPKNQKTGKEGHTHDISTTNGEFYLRNCDNPLVYE